MGQGNDNRALAKVRVLNEEHAAEVLEAALRILEQTGARVESDEAVALLKGGGAIVDGDRVRIPRELVKASLATIPKRFTVYGRDDAPPLLLGEGNTYYAPGMTCPNVLDPITSERRPFQRSDAALVGLLCDALPNIDYVIGGGIIDDVTAVLAAAYEFAELAANTSKPLLGWAHNETVLEDIYRMACAVAGGESAFRERPNCLVFVNPTSPLTMSPEAAGRILVAARHSIPIIVWPSPLSGGTAPITPAGALAATLAEALNALTVHQSCRPGAPFVLGGSINLLDMRRGSGLLWSPLRSMTNIALNDVLEHLGVIRFLPTGGTNSKTLDQQASLETTHGILSASLAGPDLVASVGLLEAGMTYSPALLVLANDVIAACRKVRQGMEVTGETLAVDTVDRVGPGGHFLLEDHTLRHFKEERWEPDLLDLDRYDDWDGRTMGERVSEQVRTILFKHKPKPLPARVQATLSNILRRAELRERRRTMVPTRRS